jgi:hypothetical protein
VSQLELLLGKGARENISKTNKYGGKTWLDLIPETTRNRSVFHVFSNEVYRAFEIVFPASFMAFDLHVPRFPERGPNEIQEVKSFIPYEFRRIPRTKFIQIHADIALYIVLGTKGQEHLRAGQSSKPCEASLKFKPFDGTSPDEIDHHANIKDLAHIVFGEVHSPKFHVR